MTEVDFDPFASGEILRVSPTTGPQKEVIASAKMSDEANTAFNEAILIWFQGELDHRVIENCLRKLIDRHDILRASFSRNGKDICLYDQKPFVLEFEDISTLDTNAQESHLDRLKLEAASSPMNLEEGPLLHCNLRKLGNDRNALLITVHHIVCDGWSFGIMLDELSTLYKRGGSDEGFEEAPSFLDFADQQEASQIANLDSDFWHEKFKSIPPALDLPLDTYRPPMRTFSAARLDWELDASLVAATRKKAGELRASHMNLLMAAYFLLLHRLTSNRDIVVGIPTAGQASFNRPKQMGHLVQLLPIRIALTGQSTFSELLGQVKSAVLDATEHPNFTFGSLLERLVVDRTRVPLISTLFNIDQAMGELDFGTAKAVVETVPRTAENFELFLNLLPSGDRLTIEATYSTVLFSEGTIRSWLQAFEFLLHQVIVDPEMALEDFSLANQLPDVIKKVNTHNLEVQSENFVDAFEKQAGKSPDSIAIISEGISTSYKDLETHSSCLHAKLRQEGIGRGDTVGICVQRSINMLASILAVLKTGASYIPLDPDFPESRLAFMMEDSGARAVIEDSATPQEIKELSVIHIDPAMATDSIVVATADLGGYGAIDSLDPAYTIYTSGSTGIPKGVTISHGSLINFLEVMAKQPGCGKDDRILAVTTLSFDISVLELFLPLITGATTIIASTRDSKDGEKIAALIEEYNPTILQATPSTWKLLLTSSWGQKQELSGMGLKAYCGGEPLTREVADLILPRVSEFWNLYGPTEATVWTTAKKIEDTRSGISIGYPIANTTAFVLDASLNPLPVSASGELYIGGIGLAISYHDREELTKECFIEHPELGRLYRTGDLAKYLPNGEIVHLGRLDNQVKIRGYRVELGEIESALIKTEEIAEAAVYLWRLSADDVRIVACCTAINGSAITSTEIRKNLRSVLPVYMVPQYILEVDSIPHLPNGKVDTASLPKPEVSASTLLDKQAVDTPMEKSIAAIWLDLLNTATEISKDDSFFEIGGHSLLALEAIRRIEQLTGVRISQADIVSKSLSAIATDLTEDNPVEESPLSRPEALTLSADRTLSAEQERILGRQLQYPDYLAYNLPAAWLIEGDIDYAVFLKSLERVFERQTALRSKIDGVAGQFRQNLYRVSELDIHETVDCSKESDAESESLRLANAAAGLPFEILSQPLVRTKLYVIEPDKHLFLLVPHQLIFDGWSFDIFINDLVSAYDALLEGKPINADPLPFEFRDFCVWSNQRVVSEDDRSYHLQRLQDSNSSDSPEDYAVRENIGRASFAYSKDELRALESRCEKYGLRLHEYLYAAFALSLGEVSQRNSLILGVAVSGRLDPDVINLIGSFVSTLPCRIELEGKDFVSDALSIAKQFNSFQDHQAISYAELFPNDASDHATPAPNIQASIAFQDARNRSTVMSNLRLEQVDIERKQIEHPVEFWCRIEANGFETIVDYDASVLADEEIQQLLELMRAFITEGQVEHSADSLANSADDDTPPNKRKGWRKLFG